MFEFRFGRGSVKRNRDAARAPNAVQRGHIVQACWTNKGDALLIQVVLPGEKASSETVSSQIHIVIRMSFVVVDQGELVISGFQLRESGGRHSVSPKWGRC